MNNMNEEKTDELPIPEVRKPEKIEYNCDVLVIGCGWAGLNAAVAAKEAGADVLVVDKGTPGYSGLSPFSSSHQWFDHQFGDDEDACLNEMAVANEYLANLNWYKEWTKYSKMIYERLMSWEFLTQYPTGADSGHYVDGDWKHDDLRGYHEEMIAFDRRTKWIETLNKYEIPYVSKTMIFDLIEKDRKIIGAVGFHVPSSAMITFHSKATILCMGGGSFKPAGFPTGCDSFDSDWLGYQHGLPIVGKEFDDFHFCASFAPGNVLSCNSWTYLENIWLCGGDITNERLLPRAQAEAKNLILPRIESAMRGVGAYSRKDVQPASGRGASISKYPHDPRRGKWTSDLPKGNVYGAAAGMQLHLGSGIWCGIDDLEGKTGLEGLWVAGDGCNGSCVSGGSYLAATGFTSNFCSVQGYLAGTAAGASVKEKELTMPEQEQINEIKKDLYYPTTLEYGFNPNWARDQLQAIMSPYWVSIVKTEKSLTNTLALVEQFRDEVIPKLVARTPHDLRLCHEMKHKVLCAEMKLRASLQRKESRGYHYRADYPYRNDEYLCYLTITKVNGSMHFDRVELKDEWKGIVSSPYEERYRTFRFPGEESALHLKNDPTIPSSGWNPSEAFHTEEADKK